MKGDAYRTLLLAPEIKLLLQSPYRNGFTKEWRTAHYRKLQEKLNVIWVGKPISENQFGKCKSRLKNQRDVL
jgi:hypothetical protein